MTRMQRREFLLTTALLPLAYGPVASALDGGQSQRTRALFSKLERKSGGRLGVFAIDTDSGARIGHRQDERFPLCSTFKVILVSAILARSQRENDFLQRRIRYSLVDLVHYSPITEKHIADGMTVSDLCAAAMQYSDNTSANLLMKQLGGPAAVTAYARSIGNHEFRLDRWETALNTCIPGDPRDTATPAAMAKSLRRIALGDALPPSPRAQLVAWLRASATGTKRIRAALPDGWQAGDKTGSGDYGTANDIGVLWPSHGEPVVIAVYYTKHERHAPWHDDVIASTTRIVLREFDLSAV